MLEFIPTSILYALPIIPIVFVSKVLHNRYANVIVSHGEKQTTHTAEEVARAVLQNNNMGNIVVESGDDYSFNGFDAEKGKVLLSPDTMGQKDISAIATVVHAVSPLLLEKTKPEKAKIRKMVGIWQPISFWTVFTFLAFGLMASNIPVVICGYLLSLTTLGLRYYNVRSDEKAIADAMNQVESLKFFGQNELTDIKKVADAMIRATA